MPKGLVALKKYYLGDVYPGQLLCWCRIDIGVNCIIVYRHDGEQTRQVRIVDDESGVSVLKAKLRSYLFARKDNPRWFLDRRPAKSEARLIIYYPSETWLTPKRSWRALGLGLWSDI